EADVPARIAEVAPEVELLIGFARDDAVPFVAMSPAGRFKVVRKVVGAAVTPKVFGVRGFADRWAAAGGRGASYRFDWAAKGAPFGACHCIELPFLFGTPEDWVDAPMLGPARAIDPDLATRMRRVWTDFARDGIGARQLRFG